MNSTIHRTSRPELTFLLLFAAGFATSRIFPPIEWASVGSVLSGVTWADIARPEVFVPAFLVLFLLLSLPALLASQRQEAEKGNRIRVSGSSTTANAGDPGAANAAVGLLLARARDEFEGQLQGMFSGVGEFIASSGRFANKLDDARSELDVAVTLEQVRGTVELLVRENAAVSRESRELRASLEEAQARIAKMKESLDQARLAASTDPLTGVANRRSLDSHLAAEVGRSHDEQTPLCLIMADIDHFKSINDTYGHQAGDEVLREFGRVLKANVRAGDMVARYGGEEFTVVLPRTTAGSALTVAERLRTVISSQTFGVSGRSIGRVTASFGIAAVQVNETPAELVARADKKVYEAKVKGRNRVEMDTSGSA